MTTSGIPFVKGHGTQNDFVLVPDPDGRLDLTPEQVAAICDRSGGLGADGLIRVVRSTALPDGVEQSGATEWFMDYRNADGGLSQMCGNGLRVFVAHLLDAGLVDLPDGGTVDVGTRAGVKRVRRDGDLYATDLGPWSVPGGEAAAAAGTDATVTPDGDPVALPALTVLTGNPHTVVALPDLDRLAAVDLSRAPVVDPVPAQGTNVELVVPLHDATATVGHLAMRVFERGVGETRSCGTGAVAAVLAARVWAGAAAPDVWVVDVPGGRLAVTVPAGDRLAGESVELTGPAVLIAEGHLRA